MNGTQARKILGLGFKFTEDELKKAYREASKKYHPDLNKDVDAQEKMQKVNCAYEFLKNNDPNSYCFEDYKKEFIADINSTVRNLKNFNLVNNYSKNIINLYNNYRLRENEIYKNYIADLKKCNSIIQINAISNTYENQLKVLIGDFIEKVFSSWEYNMYNSTFYNELIKVYEDLKISAKNSKNINEALIGFVNSVNKIIEEDNRLETHISERIRKKINKIILEYAKHPYYNILKNKIDKLQKECFDSCIQKRTSPEYRKTAISCETYIKFKIESLDEEINKIFEDYSMFMLDKPKKINGIYDVIKNCPNSEKKRIDDILNKFARELNLINDKDEFYKHYNKVLKELNSILEKLSNIIEKENKRKDVLRIKDELLLKFNLADNTNILVAKNNCDILSRSLNYISSIIDGNINMSKVLYLRKVKFIDYDNDKRILDFLENKVSYIKIPSIVVPHISDERILELYEKIKPIVDINERKYLIREFTLEEVKNLSYLDNVKENITDKISSENLEFVTDFNCYSSIPLDGNFKITTMQVLSQIPNSFKLENGAFEIVGAPIIVSDINSKVYEEYHLSKVRLYKKIG